MERLSPPRREREPSGITEIMRSDIEQKRVKAEEQLEALKEKIQKYDRQLQEIDKIPYDPVLVLTVSTWETEYDKYTWHTKEGSGRSHEYQVDTNDLNQALALTADAILKNETLRYKADCGDLELGRVSIILASETLSLPKAIVEEAWAPHREKIRDETRKTSKRWQ